MLVKKEWFEEKEQRSLLLNTDMYSYIKHQDHICREDEDQIPDFVSMDGAIFEDLVCIVFDTGR